MIAREIKNRLTSKTVDTKLIKKQITEKQKDLDKIETKFLRDEISKELFEKHSSRIKEEIEKMSEELGDPIFKSANLENQHAVLVNPNSSNGFREKKEMAIFFKITISYFQCPGLESNQHILANGRF